MKWNNKVKIKQLFTKKEDHDSVQKTMVQIADEIKKHNCFIGFDVTEFYKIPNYDDGFFKPVEYANKLIAKLYDFADKNRIWIE